MTQAAKLRGAHAQMVHAISRNFSIKDTNQIMEQLIQRCQGNLEQYIRNELLMHNHCMEIVQSLNLAMLETMLPVDDSMTKLPSSRTQCVKTQLSSTPFPTPTGSLG